LAPSKISKLSNAGNSESNRNNTNFASKENNNISPMVYCFLTDYKKLVIGGVQTFKLVTMFENGKCAAQIAQQNRKFRARLQPFGLISATQLNLV